MDLLLQRLIRRASIDPVAHPSLAIGLCDEANSNEPDPRPVLDIHPGSTRVIRSGALSVRSREFVTSARVVGASELRIFTLYVLPHSWRRFFVLVSIGVGFGILIESSLEFLGVGPLPPTVSWVR